MGRFRKLLDRVRDIAADRLDEPAGTGSTTRSEHPLDPVPEGWNQVVKARPSLQASEGQVSVRFDNLDIEVSVARGTSLLDAALDGDVDLNHYCGGMCSCGSCRLEILGGEISPKDDMEEATLAIVREGEDDRLGCQTLVMGDVVVRLPDQDF